VRYHTVFWQFTGRHLGLRWTTGAYALVLGIFLDQWRRAEPLTIHGDGSQRRDFVHVADVVEANILAYRSHVQEMALNVGSGTNLSVKERADLISPNQVQLPRRAGDADATLADISRITRVLGWHPRVPFDEGVKEMMARAFLDDRV
jgi:nucleoside-diphosphate-sugar epimerase